MTKAELVKSIAEKAELSQKDSEAALKAFMETVEETLVAGDKIQLTGWGTFEVRERKARTGHNPQTKELMEIPASKSAGFKVGKKLKEALNS